MKTEILKKDYLEEIEKDNLKGYILNVNKPPGISSFSVVKRVRKVTGIKKVGHAGTLDPFATGVLLIVLGKATKLVEDLMTLPKEYIGVVKLGVITDTYDTEGKVMEENPAGHITEKMVRDKLNDFQGKIEQIPPIYSALKYKGKPLYSYARKGIDIKPQPRQVEISEIELLEFNNPEAKIRVKCSRGTYIRSIAYDLGIKLGCGAMLKNLTRVSIGNYNIESSLEFEELQNELEENIV